VGQNQRALEARQRKARSSTDWSNLEGTASSQWEHAVLGQSAGALVNNAATPATAQANLTDLLKQLILITTTSHSIELLITRLAAAIGTNFQADGCLVAFCEEHGKPSKLGWWLAKENDLLDQSFTDQACLIQQLQLETNSLHLNEIKQVRQSLWQHLHLSAELAATAIVVEAPTQSLGIPNGWISLMRSSSHRWTTAELEMLELVSQQIAIVFSQRQLQLQVKQQHQYQRVVSRLSLAIRNAANLTDVLTLATNEIAAVLGAIRGILLRVKYLEPFLRNDAIATLPQARLSVVCDWQAAIDESQAAKLVNSDAVNPSFLLSDCDLCQQAFKASHPLTYTHQPASSNQPTLIRLHRLLNLDQSNSLTMTRLESQGMVLGFLLFQNNSSYSWQQADLEFVSLVGAQVSSAIIQTETLRQVQSLVEKRTAELQQSLAIQAKLYERTRQQVKQLHHLNQLKDEFLDTVSHELRTPLTSMALAIQMLRQVGTDRDRSDRYLNILEQQCAQETRLVNDLLTLRELESEQITLQVEKIDCIQLIETQAQTFRQQWAETGLDLDLTLPPHSVKIESDRGSLNRILAELLTNAGKYSTPYSRVQLELMHRREPSTAQQIIFSLTNVGAGIPREELPYIFDKFRRCQGSIQNAIQGTGLGLALVKNLVQLLSGTLSVSSSPIENSTDWETCFSLILPTSFDSVKSIPA